MNDSNFLGGRSRFIIASKLVDRKDTGIIMDKDREILAYFEHKHSWKHPQGRSPSAHLKAKTTDVQIISTNKTLLGEIHEFPPPVMSMRLIRRWDIYNTEKELKGVVREKPKFIGTSWVLENPRGKIIATVKGNPKKKNYKILTKRNQTIAHVYRSVTVDKNSYFVDTQHSEIDFFLVLSYIIVLDLAKTTWRRKSPIDYYS